MKACCPLIFVKMFHSYVMVLTDVPSLFTVQDFSLLVAKLLCAGLGELVEDL